MRVVMLKYGARERLNLRERQRRPSKIVPSDCRRFYPAANRKVVHLTDFLILAFCLITTLYAFTLLSAQGPQNLRRTDIYSPHPSKQGWTWLRLPLRLVTYIDATSTRGITQHSSLDGLSLASQSVQIQQRLPCLDHIHESRRCCRIQDAALSCLEGGSLQHEQAGISRTGVGWLALRRFVGSWVTPSMPLCLASCAFLPAWPRTASCRGEVSSSV